ncbi:MAG TPA: PPOX class F420-dependent oxidoreductase, partial [Mycobacterium sp.]
MTFTPFEIEFIKQADVGRLATIQPDGTPQN